MNVKKYVGYHVFNLQDAAYDERVEEERDELDHLLCCDGNDMLKRRNIIVTESYIVKIWKIADWSTKVECRIYMGPTELESYANDRYK